MLDSKIKPQFVEEHVPSILQDHPLIKVMGGYSSDHALRCLSMNIANSNLNFATWNTLNRCHDSSSLSYSNNPANLTENDWQYFSRRMYQSERIKIMSKDLDFFCLQEFTSDSLAYLRDLEKISMKIVISKSLDNNKQRHLLTLFNSNKFTLLFEQSCILLNNCYMGYEMLFENNVTKEQIAIINVHLDYKDNIKQNKIIQDIRTKYKTANIMCIIAGDFNHTNGYGIAGISGNNQACSNIFNENNTLTTVHKPDNNTEVPRTIDGFIITTTQNYARVLYGDKFNICDGKVFYTTFFDSLVKIFTKIDELPKDTKKLVTTKQTYLDAAKSTCIKKGIWRSKNQQPTGITVKK